MPAVVMRLRSALALGGLLLLAAAWHAGARAPLDPAAGLPALDPLPAPAAPHVRFIVYGDAGHGGAGQHRVAAAMAQWARRGGLGFVVSTGDNFYDDGVTSADDPQWRAKFEAVYADPALGVPFYIALGNHDHRGSVEAQIAYAARSPRWHLPARQYTVSHRLSDGTAVELFVADTTPVDQGWSGAEAGVRWLDGVLRASDAHWRIAVGHHPLYSNARRGDNARTIAAYQALFARHGVDLYFAGHDHVLELHRPVGGVVHVTSGGGGGPEWGYGVAAGADAPFAATLGGFVGATVTREAIRLEFVRPDGRTQYVHELRRGAGR